MAAYYGWCNTKLLASRKDYITGYFFALQEPSAADKGKDADEGPESAPVAGGSKSKSPEPADQEGGPSRSGDSAESSDESDMEVDIEKVKGKVLTLGGLASVCNTSCCRRLLLFSMSSQYQCSEIQEWKNTAQKHVAALLQLA